MKDRLKRYFSFYFNTWWCPPLMLVIFHILASKIKGGVLFQPYDFTPSGWEILFSLLLSMVFVIANLFLFIGWGLFFIGVPVSWGWLLAKKNYRGILWSILACIVIIVLLMLYFYFTLPSRT